jgi:hypothetical protein
VAHDLGDGRGVVGRQQVTTGDESCDDSFLQTGNPLGPSGSFIRSVTADTESDGATVATSGVIYSLTGGSRSIVGGTANPGKKGAVRAAVTAVGIGHYFILAGYIGR